MPTDSTDELRLSRLFSALANPVVRHLVELLGLEDRAPFEIAKHFDLSANDIVTTLLRAGLLRSERPGRVSVDQAMGFLNEYVSVREILRDWPNGAQIEKALRLAQVPPALPPQRAGEPFYQRSYVQQIAAAFDRRNQVARSFIKA